MLSTVLRSLLALFVGFWAAFMDAIEDNNLTRREAEKLAILVADNARRGGVDLVPLQVHGVEVLDDETTKLGLRFLARLAVASVEAARAGRTEPPRRLRLAATFGRWNLWQAVQATVPAVRSWLAPILAAHLLAIRPKP